VYNSAQREFTDAGETLIIWWLEHWLNGHWWLDCYTWYSEEGPEWAVALPTPLLAVPNVQWPVYQLRMIW